jgi:hypothetical protein
LAIWHGFRGKTVEEVIRESVESYLDRSNYNNCKEITGALEAVGVKVDAGVCDATFPRMLEMIERRHQIVHRADRNDAGGTGNHRVSSIGRDKVRDWISAVRTFSNAVLDAC